MRLDFGKVACETVEDLLYHLPRQDVRGCKAAEVSNEMEEYRQKLMDVLKNLKDKYDMSKSNFAESAMEFLQSVVDAAKIIDCKDATNITNATLVCHDVIVKMYGIIVDEVLPQE